MEIKGKEDQQKSQELEARKGGTLSQGKQLSGLNVSDNKEL